MIWETSGDHFYEVISYKNIEVISAIFMLVEHFNLIYKLVIKNNINQLIWINRNMP